MIQESDIVEMIIKNPRRTAICLSRLYRFGGLHGGSTVLSHTIGVMLEFPDEPLMVFLAGIHDCHEIVYGEIPLGYKADVTKQRQDAFDQMLFRRMTRHPTADELARLDVADKSSGDRERKQLDDAGGFIEIERELWIVEESIDRYVRLMRNCDCWR